MRWIPPLILLGIGFLFMGFILYLHEPLHQTFKMIESVSLEHPGAVSRGFVPMQDQLVHVSSNHTLNESNLD